MNEPIFLLSLDHTGVTFSVGLNSSTGRYREEGSILAVRRLRAASNLMCTTWP